MWYLLANADFQKVKVLVFYFKTHVRKHGFLCEDKNDI